MYSFSSTQTLDAPVEKVWSVWSDPDSFPRWDPREEHTELTGPFAVGSTIRSKQRGIPQAEMVLTGVTPGERWTISSPLPGGRLTIDHVLIAEAAGRTSVTKAYEVTGPMGLLFRCYFGPIVRKAMPDTFRALEAEALRRG
ncbi:MAG: SRPBCC family protein [Micropruina sp.]|uniref:SRPBCC family protein n=1 Tax=Micropruina sp. TaxID=2737536 RepID=UPI0039E26D4E